MKKALVWIIIIVAILIVLGVVYDNKKTENVPSAPEQGRVMGPEELALKVGETKTGAGLTVKLNSVPNDYRCATDVQCIEAGAIVANVTLAAGDETLTRNVPSDEVPIQFAGYAISIIKIEPPLLSTRPTAQSEYVVTFKVEPLALQTVDNNPGI
jgi:hypothetical protein